MAIKKRVSIRYEDEDNGFIYTFAPIEETLKVKKTKGGYEVKYLAQDMDYQPDNLDDDNLFLVHYHRDFWIEHKNVISENSVRAWYQGEKIDQADDYHIFPVTAYIHSGVMLYLGDYPNPTGQGCGEWDTSHVGAVLVAKSEWKRRDKARKAAEGLIEEINKINSGEVFAIVKETFDKDKNRIDHDAVWGFVGEKYALESLETL